MSGPIGIPPVEGPYDHPNTIKCPHCLASLFLELDRRVLGRDKEGNWFIEYGTCPNCSKVIARLACVSSTVVISGMRDFPESAVSGRYLVRPKATGRDPLPKNVPTNLASDYNEAVLVLADSPKASAALSRRCLQNILRNVTKVKPSVLSKEIAEAKDMGVLPSYITDELDMMKQVGDFAAHPTKDTSTGEIIDVEPGEAEFNLDVLEHIFDFYYVQLEKNAQLKARMNEKLEAAKRRPLQG